MSMKNYRLLASAITATVLGSSLHASIALVATASLSGTASDLSGLTGNLENGVAANLLGGMGSGLAWAGGNTFLALPDRGPNATTWKSSVDDTTSYIPRFNTVTLDLSYTNGSYSLTPTLTGTTLLYSTTALNYASASSTNGNIAGDALLNNAAGKYYFSGRSDNYSTGNSLNSNNARLDPEGIRVSKDGTKVYVSDEYGPYVYEFDRSTGARTHTFNLPTNLAVTNLSPLSNTEISNNTVGRIANKGMEGLAITPDGTKLYGFMQSPLEQDSTGGAGKGSINRVVTIDIATGATTELAYNNKVGTKTYNSSEMLAINDHQFLVLERDGSGLGNGDSTAFKSIYMVDYSSASDITSLSGETTIATYAPSKSLFLDLKSVLNSNGITDANIPAKLEGMAFGSDIEVNGTTFHTLLVANDNDFVQGVAGDNKWFAFTFTNADLTTLGVTGGFTNQQFTSGAIPEPSSYAAIVGALGLGLAAYRRRRSAC